MNLALNVPSLIRQACYWFWAILAMGAADDLPVQQPMQRWLAEGTGRSKLWPLKPWDRASLPLALERRTEIHATAAE